MKTRHAISLVGLLGGGVWVWSAQAQSEPLEQVKPAVIVTPAQPATAQDIKALAEALLKPREWKYKVAVRHPGWNTDPKGAETGSMNFPGWEVVDFYREPAAENPNQSYHFLLRRPQPAHR